MSDCVPYAIHIATGEDLQAVLSIAQRRGWDSVNGMNVVAAWCMLRDDMGFQITPMTRPENRVTLKRFLPTLDVTKTYIISVADHWFTVREGQRFDKANTHPRTEVFAYIEVRQP
ncbi:MULTISPECIES: hypothetical protein [Pseudomonas]|uniref:hypothetical protein n=1 Tax=Pseudomonas TaxID=286 RepID=UPI0007100979|nr:MULTISPECIES: hypothetical protein [Pseudomonas]KQW19790.1 hypothetical protein ASC85_08040 [Pseudomonas sp. Root401]PWD01974.1 hypothetical protein CX658_18635 [Pseudomonas amygdali pv. lachrymans]WHS57372.1 hypothetical protein QLH64_30610 [Pseudomonas brassicacearum]WNZ87547.1 hypothetical protein QOM10_30135 [Pseudomonas sp. P108]